MQTLPFVYEKEVRKLTNEELENVKEKVRALQKRYQPEQRTPAWYEFRKNMLTASDYAAAMGLNPYSSPYQVVKKKCEKNNTFRGSAATEWGNTMMLLFQRLSTRLHPVVTTGMFIK